MSDAICRSQSRQDSSKVKLQRLVLVSLWESVRRAGKRIMTYEENRKRWDDVDKTRRQDREGVETIHRQNLPAESDVSLSDGWARKPSGSFCSMRVDHVGTESTNIPGHA